MRVILLLTIGCFVVLQTTSQIADWVPYDCRRLNSQCFVGICQSTDGTCVCNGGSPSIPGFEGFDCRLKTDEINPGGCTGFGGCSAGSTCYTRGGEDFCYCSATHTGPKCDQKRVDVSVCNETHFGLYIKPHTDGLFAGVISLIKEEPFDRETILTTDGCVGVKQSDQSYQILTTTDTTLGGTNPCSEALQKNNITRGDQFVYKVRVTYLQTTSTVFDETHTFICQVTTDGAVGGLSVGDDRMDSTGVTVTGIHMPAAIEFVNRTGDVPARPSLTSEQLVFVGQELFVRVFLLSGSRYRKLAVDNCASHPEKSHISDRTIVFLEDRCPKSDALYLVDGGTGTVRLTEDEVLVAIYAIKYNPSNMFYVSCNVTLCTDDNLSDCDSSDCAPHLGNVTSGAGRRKRATGSPDYQFITQNALVVDTKAQYDAIRGTGTPQYIYTTVEQPCLHNPVFIFVLSAVGLLFVVSASLLVLLCYRRRSACKTTKELM